MTVCVGFTVCACSKCPSTFGSLSSNLLLSSFCIIKSWTLSGGVSTVMTTALVDRCDFPGRWHSRPLCCAGPEPRLPSGRRSLMWGARRAVWVFGQEPGQTGAECDGVITLLAALLSALAWMPLFIHPKRHIIGPREWDILATDPRVEVKGNRGADERERNYGRKTKRNLVSKQLFWWEGGRGSAC